MNSVRPLSKQARKGRKLKSEQHANNCENDRPLFLVYLYSCVMNDSVYSLKMKATFVSVLVRKTILPFYGTRESRTIMAPPW